MLLGVLGGMVTMAEASSPEDRLRDYLQRLTGKPVEAATAVALSSARKAQLAAWLRREGIAFKYAQIDRPSITLADILGGGSASGSPPPGSTPPPGPVTSGGVAPAAALPAMALRIGIDIESAANLPAADDYRTNAFYKENFSAREIAHCLQRGDPRDSLCGLWAAKEAIVKAGAAERPGSGAMASVEVLHDGAGAPNYPGCALSISHEAGLAVAVCLHFGGTAA